MIETKRWAILIISIGVAMMLSAQSINAGQQRSYRAKAEFIKDNPCPSTGNPKASRKCPGYVVDHIKPLACGGADAPHNMQWQTVEDAKAKDKWERKSCQL